jgi:hypothetical protein
MKIVINIDDDLYKSIIGHRYKNTHQKKCDYEDLINAIYDGTPLPKWHGRLIDTDDIRVIELEDSLHTIRHEKGDEIYVYIDAPTIIEADKAESKE